MFPSRRVGRAHDLAGLAPAHALQFTTGMRLAVIVLLALIPATASAQYWSGPPGEAPIAPLSAPAPTQVEVNYGKQTLVADGVAVALVLGAAMQDHSDSTGQLLGLGLVTYVTGAPIVHLVNGQTKEAGQSVALRLGLPLLAGLVGNEIGPKDKIYCDSFNGSSCPQPNSSAEGAALGALAGVVAAMVIDARYIATKKVTIAPQITPSFGYANGMVRVGVGGSF
jgi:hypothetical protein